MAPYKSYTSVGPTFTRPVQDPLAVALLDNQLYMLLDSHMKIIPFDKKILNDEKVKRSSFTFIEWMLLPVVGKFKTHIQL